MALRAIVATFCAVPIAACGLGNPTKPSRPLDQRLVAGNYLFLFAAGDTVEPNRQTAYDDWLVQILGVVRSRRIIYNKYFNRDHMGEIVQIFNTNGWADVSRFAIHTINSFDNHEVVHLYASEFGEPPGILEEGFAVAHSTDPASSDFTARWGGEPVHDAARRLRAQGLLPSPSTLAESSAFRNVDSILTYPMAGSFVRYLLDRYGYEPFRALFGRLKLNDSAATINVGFSQLYGKSLIDLEGDWLMFLGTPGSDYVQ